MAERFDQVDLCQSDREVFVRRRIRFISCGLLYFVREPQQIIKINMKYFGQGFNHLEARLSFSVLILGYCHFIKANAISDLLLGPAALLSQLLHDLRKIHEKIS